MTLPREGICKRFYLDPARAQSLVRFFLVFLLPGGL